MSGGLGVIADVPKTMVYRIARWLNGTPDARSFPTRCSPKRRPRSCGRTRPIRIRCRPYDILDDILQRHIERHQSADDIVAAGFERATVAARPRAGAQCRVQAEAGGARTEGHRSRVRHRLAHADRREVELVGRRPLPVPPSPVHPQPQLGMTTDVHLEHVSASLREFVDASAVPSGGGSTGCS